MPQELDENTDCRLMWEVKIPALCLRNFLKHYLLKTRATVVLGQLGGMEFLMLNFPP